MAEPKVEDIIKWTEALRSGKYKQTSCTLQDKNGYCCLGVACDIFISKADRRYFGKYLDGAYPDAQRYAPNWLKSINEDFETLVKAKADTAQEIGLSSLNDYHELTFDEIADCLEAVYIHKVLE